MDLISTPLVGCFQVLPFLTEDNRGNFVKTFHSELFANRGLPVDWREDFYSNSRKGVIRGMHFQTPPYDQEKLVYCLQGKVLDVVLDLRTKSPTFGGHFAIELDAKHAQGLMIPKGVAHGYLTLTENALVAYKVTSVHEPQNDKGILWSSFGFDWGVQEPIISERDRSFSKFSDFISPF